MNMREAPKDRISDLPDSLLYHILDFLDISDGARTSTLSKRWNFIWTTVPTLEFKSFLASNNYIPTSYQTDKFMDFVDGTLHRHNSSSVDKFALRCNHHLNESRIHSWVSTVVRGNVKELRLHLRQDHPLFIPLSLFTCASLISLELITQPNVRLPKYISFPRLKRLELHCFKFTDECWNEELFSNSHVLEELILDFCSVRMKCFCISIPTLKHLKIDNWIEDEDGLRDCVFKIDAPRLVTLLYTSPAAKEFILSSFLSLEEATININFEEPDTVDTAKISRLLRAVAHAKYLSVCKLTLQTIYSNYDLSNNLNLPTFHNVKKLMITDVISSDRGLIGLLNAVPNLESLVIQEFMLDEEEEDSDDAEVDGNDNNKIDDAGSVDGENNHVNPKEDVSDAAERVSNDQGEANNNKEDDSWAVGIRTTECLFPNLKSVCFQNFSGNPREIRWVKLILRNAKALQKMVTCYSDCDLRFANVKSEKELTAEIPSFPRASPGCVIKVCSRYWSEYFSR